MPLFGRKSKPAQPVDSKLQPIYAQPSSRSSGLFHRNHSPTSRTTAAAPSRSATLSSSSSGGNSAAAARRSGLFGRRRDDKSVVNTRAHVAKAESKELEAKRAYREAEQAANIARKEVKSLEREAAAEARAAELKQSQTNAISKRARPLGRKFF